MQWKKYLISEAMNELKPTIQGEEKGIPAEQIEMKNNIKALLEEYNLQAFLANFLVFAEKFINMKLGWQEFEKDMNLISTKHDELISALNLLLKNPNEIRIDIKHTRIKEAVSIRNPYLIQIIKAALILEYQHIDLFIEEGLVQPEEISDWAKYLDFAIVEGKALNPLKHQGRKMKHGKTTIMIYSLQKFLQENSYISRKQALFIYKFLTIIKIIPDNLAWKEDNIRHLVTRYKRLKEGQKPIDMEKEMKEYISYEKKIKAKIQKIIKK